LNYGGLIISSFYLPLIKNGISFSTNFPKNE